MRRCKSASQIAAAVFFASGLIKSRVASSTALRWLLRGLSASAVASAVVALLFQTRASHLRKARDRAAACSEACSSAMQGKERGTSLAERVLEGEHSIVQWWSDVANASKRCSADPLGVLRDQQLSQCRLPRLLPRLLRLPSPAVSFD